MKEIILLILIGILLVVIIKRYPSGAECPADKRCTLQPSESTLAGKTDQLCGNVSDALKPCLNIEKNYLLSDGICSIGLPNAEFKDKNIILNSDKKCKTAINPSTKDLELCQPLQLPPQVRCNIVKNEYSYDKSDTSDKIVINSTNNEISFPGMRPIEIQKGNYSLNDLATLISNTVKEKSQIVKDFQVSVDGRVILKATNLIIDVSNPKCKLLMTMLGMTEQDVQDNRITIKGSKTLSGQPIYSSNFYCMKYPYAQQVGTQIQWMSNDMCYLPDSANPDSKWKPCQLDVQQGNCPNSYYQLDNTSCCRL